MSFVPCSDGEPLGYAVQMQSVDTDAHHDHTDGEDDDDCTPFCSCDCCHVPVTVPQIPVSQQVMLSQNYSYTFLYTFNYSFDYSLGVWRPPNFSA